MPTGDVPKLSLEQIDFVFAHYAIKSLIDSQNMKYDYSRIRDGLVYNNAVSKSRPSLSVSKEHRNSFSSTLGLFPTSNNKLIYNYKDSTPSSMHRGEPLSKRDNYMPSGDRQTKSIRYKPIDESKALQQIEGLKMQLSKLEQRKRARILKQNGMIRVEQNYERGNFHVRGQQLKIALAQLQSQKQAVSKKNEALYLKQQELKQLRLEAQSKAKLIQKLADNIREFQTQRQQLNQRIQTNLEFKSKYQLSTALIQSLDKQAKTLSQNLAAKTVQSSLSKDQLATLKLNIQKSNLQKQNVINNLNKKIDNLEKQINSLHLQISDKGKRCYQLTKQLQHIQYKCSNFQESFERLNKQKAFAQSEISKLKMVVQDYINKQKQSTARSNQQIQRIKCQYQQKLQSLSIQYKDFKNSNQELSKLTKEAEKSKQESTNKIILLQKTIEQQQNQKSDLATLCENLKQDFQIRIQTSRTQMVNIQERSLQKVEEVNRKNRQILKQNKNLKNRLQQLQAENQQIIATMNCKISQLQLQSNQQIIGFNSKIESIMKQKQQQIDGLVSKIQFQQLQIMNQTKSLYHLTEQISDSNEYELLYQQKVHQVQLLNEKIQKMRQQRQEQIKSMSSDISQQMVKQLNHLTNTIECLQQQKTLILKTNNIQKAELQFKLEQAIQKLQQQHIQNQLNLTNIVLLQQKLHMQQQYLQKYRQKEAQLSEINTAQIQHAQQFDTCSSQNINENQEVKKQFQKYEKLIQQSNSQRQALEKSCLQIKKRWKEETSSLKFKLEEAELNARKAKNLERVNQALRKQLQQLKNQEPAEQTGPSQ